MSHLSLTGIVLRSIEHGEYDKIITFFTLEQGKISFIAKGAKRSVRRFGGSLEIFSAVSLVGAKGKGLPMLQEATLVEPFEHIRTDVTRTAYASYWCELVSGWMEEEQAHIVLYTLLYFSLTSLSSGRCNSALSGLMLPRNSKDLSLETINIAFVLRFLAIAGFRPGFNDCNVCHRLLDDLDQTCASFDVRRGGVLCDRCASASHQLRLAKGTIKMLAWSLDAPLDRLARVRFSKQALKEAVAMLELFVPHHLGRETKSWKFLKQLAALGTRSNTA